MSSQSFATSLGLFVLRVSVGLTLALGHGMPKLVAFETKKLAFADPLGVGSELSLVLAIVGELVCGVLVAAGAFTRLSCVPALFTMLVAAFVVHADDPFARKELALMFVFPLLAILIAGPGSIALDSFRSRR